MRTFSNYFLALLFLTVLIVVFFPWFFRGEIIGGDWPYFYKEMLEEFQILAPLWTAQGGIGLGGVNPNFPFFSYQHFIVGLFVNTFGIPWIIVYKIFWFGLFIALSIISIVSLIKTVFKTPTLWQISIAALVYLTNTYILMIVGGGQMGIALAYSIAPLVLVGFIKFTEFIAFTNPKLEIGNLKFEILRKSGVAGLIFALQILFDLRIAYLTMMVGVLYVLFHYVFIKKFNLKLFTIYYLLFTIVVVGLHSYWIFPFIFLTLFSLPEGITSIDGFKFFSFADFSHSLSLLHPNWPENIFGKTYFLRPEFLTLPILAYSSLLFINNGTMKQLNNRNIIFFALLGLIGTFLAKGVNPPFEEINMWLFNNIAGMNMFRDPTKFYLLIALSYSILIPFSTYSIYKWLSAKCKVQSAKLQLKVKSYIPILFLLFTIFYLLFLIRPALLGQLGGTFKSYKIPTEYEELKDFIVSQPEFFRTLWVPTQSRFRIQTEKHPLINADVFFKTSSQSAIIQKLATDDTKDLLNKLAVKYIIVPYDSTEEIFLEDRKYDHTKRINIEKELDKIGWLNKVQTGKITIYETPQ